MGQWSDVEPCTAVTKKEGAYPQAPTAKPATQKTVKQGRLRLHLKWPHLSQDSPGASGGPQSGKSWGSHHLDSSHTPSDTCTTLTHRWDPQLSPSGSVPAAFWS